MKVIIFLFTYSYAFWAELFKIMEWELLRIDVNISLSLGVCVCVCVVCSLTRGLTNTQNLLCRGHPSFRNPQKRICAGYAERQRIVTLYLTTAGI
jgi:sulfur relay (sulfurtransferase) complex TusBCD TusD component (DsrE family)